MRSPLERSWALTALVTIALAMGPLAAQQPVETPRRVELNKDDVRSATAEVAADPNLAAERTVRTLRWRGSDEPSREPAGWLVSLLRFVRGIFEWLAASGRLLLWVAGAILAGLLAVFVTRVVRALHRAPPQAKRFVAPSHVRDLDIRPETLPDDIGSAAAALWDEGNHRAALALLYRGLLSRLVHAHGVPIKASSTEGDCLTLAEPRLDRTATLYAQRLVTTWRNAVYGGLEPATRAVHDLCDEFAARIGRNPATNVATT